MDRCRCSGPFCSGGPWPIVVPHTRPLGIGSDTAPGEVMKATAMCKANCDHSVKRMLSCYGWMAVYELASYRGYSIYNAGSSVQWAQETLDRKRSSDIIIFTYTVRGEIHGQGLGQGIQAPVLTPA